MVRPRESNSRPPALQSNALPTELVLPRLLTDLNCVCAKVYEMRVFKSVMGDRAVETREG